MPVFIMLIIFGSFFGTIAYVASRHHVERMELIRLGHYHRVMPGNRPKTGSVSLFFGLLLAFFGIALLLSAILLQDMDRDMVTGSLLFIFSGGAMLIYWRLTAKDRDEAMRIAREQYRILEAEAKSRDERGETGSFDTE